MIMIEWGDKMSTSENEINNIDLFLSNTMEEMAKEVNLAMKTLKDGTLPDEEGEPSVS